MLKRCLLINLCLLFAWIVGSVELGLANPAKDTATEATPVASSGSSTFQTSQPRIEQPNAFYLPLDDRPCNYLFPGQIARIGGGLLRTPDRVYLGSAFTPGHPAKLKDWLRSCPGNSTMIISADMLAYGGLLASRTSATSLEQALDNLQVLEELSQAGHSLRVLVTQPRLSLCTSTAAAPYEAALRNWACRNEKNPPANVPDSIFQEYQAVRMRNFQVTEHLLQLAKSGVIDRLIIGQDDSAAKGIHIEELNKLHEEVNELGLEGKVSILCGADELGACLAAGWLAEVNNYYPNIELIYSDPTYEAKVPPMEYYTLGETARRHLDICQAKASQGTGTVIFVETPADKPFEPPSAEGTPETKTAAQELLKRIDLKFSQEGRLRPYGLADLHLVNRAEPILAQTIIDNLPMWQLACYSAWNTPSNSLGTAIAQACAQQIALVRGHHWSPYRRLESEKTQQAFTMARLVDDYAYQALIRQTLTGQYKNIDIRANPLLNQAGPASVEVRAMAIPWAQRLWQEKLQGKTFDSAITGEKLMFADMYLEIVLPWPRLFEIEERLNLTLQVQKEPTEKASYLKSENTRPTEPKTTNSKR